MIKIINRRGVLYLRFHANGKEYKRSAGLKDTKENRKILARSVIPALLERIERGDFGGNGGRKTLWDFLDLYLKEREGVKSYYDTACLVRALKKAFHERLEVTNLKPSMIREWLYNHSHLKVNTLYRYITVLRGALKLALQDGVIERDPLLMVNLPKGSSIEVTPFTRDEVARILKHTSGDFRLYFALAVYTGARSGEILALKWEDVNFMDSTITINKTLKRGVIQSPKTKHSVRKIPLFEKLRPFLLSHKQESGFLFRGKDGRLISVEYAGAYWKWRALLESLGIAYRRLYETRHTFATHALSTGLLSVMEVARILGHSSPQMVLTVYGRCIEGEQLKIARNFDPFREPNWNKTGTLDN